VTGLRDFYFFFFFYFSDLSDSVTLVSVS